MGHHYMCTSDGAPLSYDNLIVDLRYTVIVAKQIHIKDYQEIDQNLRKIELAIISIFLN